MTEQEWLGSGIPILMLHDLRFKLGVRKLFLFAAGCYSVYGERIDGVSIHEATIEDLEERAKTCSSPPPKGLSEQHAVAMQARKEAQESLVVATPERRQLADLLREVMGNPFRPVAIDPEWLTPTVTAFACVLYDERTFEDMPILADALEDAGCDNDDILDHCRSAGPHVRGCWVLDLILGRE